MDNRLEIVLTAKDITGKAFNKVTSRIKSMTSSVMSFNGVMAGAVGAAGIGLFIKKNLEAADSIAKTADTIGVTTRSLQEYRFMAERSGVATNELDKGLGAFSKRLGELRIGTGALNTLLSKNNEVLKNQLVAAGSTDEALAIFLNTLGKIENQSDKTALSAAAFSRTAGIKMTNLVKGGSGALAGMRKEFSDLGLAIDEKWLRQSEKAVDQFTNLEYAVKTRLMGAVVKTAPEITKLVGSMADWVAANDTFLTQDIPGHIANMGKAVKEFTGSTEFKLIKEYWEAMAGGAIGGKLFGVPGAIGGIAAGAFYSAYKDLKKLTADQVFQVNTLTAEYEHLGRQIEDINTMNPDPDLVKVLQARRVEIQKEIQAMVKVKKVTDENTGSVETHKNAKKTLIKTNAAAAESFKFLSAYIAGSGVALQDATNDIKAYEIAQDKAAQKSKKDLHGWYVADRETTKQDPETYYQDWVDQHNAALSEQKENAQAALDEQTAAYEHMYNEVHDIAADFWGDILDGQIKSWDDMLDHMLDSFKQTFAQILAKASTKIVMDILVGGQGSAGSAGSGGGILGTLGSKLGSGILDNFSLKGLSNGISGLFGSGATPALSGYQGLVAGDRAFGTFGSQVPAAGGSSWSSMFTGAAGVGVIAASAMIAGKVLGRMFSEKPQFGISGMAKEDWKFGTGSFDLEINPYEIAMENMYDDFKSNLYDYRVFAADFDNEPEIRKTLFDYFDTVFANIDGAISTDINDILQEYQHLGVSFRVTDDMNFEQAFAGLSDAVFSELLGSLLLSALPGSGAIEKSIKTITGSQYVTAGSVLDKTGHKIGSREYYDSAGFSSQAKGTGADPYLYTEPVYENIKHQVSAMADVFNVAFFDAIMPEGSTSWDGFLFFADTVKKTDDFMDKFNDRMTDFNLTAADAFGQIAFVSGAIADLDAIAESFDLDPAALAIKNLVIGFETLTTALKENNATVDELATAKKAQEKTFWEAIKDSSADAVGTVQAMADLVKGFVFSSDQTKLQGIAAQGEKAIKYFNGLYDSVAAAGNAEFTASAKALKDGIGTIVNTLMAVEGLNIFKGHLSTIGSAKANIYGMENEWSTMNIGSKYGVNLGSAKEQAAFVKSVLGVSATEFVKAAEIHGVSVQDAANDMAILSDIVKDTAGAFEDIEKTMQDTRQGIIGSSAVLSPGQQYSQTMKAFKAAAVLAMDLDPEMAKQGAQDLAKLSGQVLEYKKASTTSFFEYQAIESEVLSTLKKVEDFSSTQVKLLDLGDPKDQLKQLTTINTNIDLTKTAIDALLKDTTFTTAFSGFNDLFNEGSVFGTLNSTLINLPTALGDAFKNITVTAGLALNQALLDIVKSLGLSSGAASAISSQIVTNPVTGQTGPASVTDPSQWEPWQLAPGSPAVSGKSKASILADYGIAGAATSEISAAIANWDTLSLSAKDAWASSIGTDAASMSHDVNQLKVYGYEKGGTALGLSIVGEKGPELINFKSPANVYSNNDTGDLMGKAMVPLLNEVKALRKDNESLRKDVTLMRIKIQKFHQDGIPVRNSNEDLVVT